MLERLVCETRWRDAFWLISTIYLAWYFAIASHEMGHYAAARSLDLIPTKVVIGDLGTLYDKTHAGTEFVLRAGIGLMGRAGYTTVTGSLSQAGALLLMAAGIMVNFFLGGLLWAFAWRLENLTLFLFGQLSLLVGITQLIPLPEYDGHYLWNLLWYQTL